MRVLARLLVNVKVSVSTVTVATTLEETLVTWMIVVCTVRMLVTNDVVTVFGLVVVVSVGTVIVTCMMEGVNTVE